MKTKEIYLPLDQRYPDEQYKRVLREILEYGHWTKETMQGVPTKSLIVPTVMHFKLSNGFPLITERTLNSVKMEIPVWKKAVGEIIGFLNGVHTHKELVEKYGCNVWADFVTKKKCATFGLTEGDLGLGSYGKAFTSFPTENGPMNQVEIILKQIQEKPFLKTHFISPWIPQHIIGNNRKTVVAPCHGWMFFHVDEQKQMTLTMVQRSADVPVGVPSNMTQYAALLIMFSQICGTIPYEFVHVLIDAHIYENQIPMVEQMLERENRIFPTMVISDPSIKKISDFRPEHFILEEYYPHLGIKIPVSI